MSLPLASLILLAAAPHAFERQTVEYVSGGGDARSMDLYLPGQVKDAPVLMFLHGGVWAVGDKAQYENVGRAFAQRGIVTAVVNYPLYPRANHDAQVAATRDAVRWMVAHAAGYGASPARLFLMGHSAGAELATTLLFGPDPPRLAGVVGLCGIYDLRAPIADEEGGGFEQYISPVFGKDPRRWRPRLPSSSSTRRRSRCSS